MKILTRKKPLYLAIAGILFSGYASSSIAVQAETTAAESEDKKIDKTIEVIEIVSGKRPKSLQDVSASVTAMSAGELDTMGVARPEDLNGLVPGMTVSKSEGFRKIITIRGLGLESAQNDVANPSVSYHVDGVYIASDLSLNTDFLDVERIEVLRGPQGTLFGQNSTGGTINVISQKPALDDFEGQADLTIGSFNTRKIRASVNVPIGETLAARVSFSALERDGYTKNIALDDYDLDEATNTTYRVQLLWQPTDDFSAIARMQHFDRDGNGAAQRSITDPGNDVRKISHDYPDKFAFESDIYSLTLEWQLEDFLVKTISSYQDEIESSKRDNDRSIEPLSLVNLSSRAPTATTHEINIVSSGDDNFIDWIVGAFYLDQESTINFAQFDDLNGDGVIDETVDFDNPFGHEVGFATIDTVHKRKSWSVFTQGTFNISDTSRLIAGLRYGEDELNSRVCNFWCDDVAFLAPDLVTSKADKLTGKFGVEYDYSEDGMLYATYSKGFKPGGTNLSYDTVVSATYEAEDINAYEVGSKMQLFGNTMQLNTAAFYYDYKNYQFQTSDPKPFSGGVDNIPESESMGVELEFKWIVSDSITLDANFAYLDTEITSSHLALDSSVAAELQGDLGNFDPAATIARAPGLQDIKGNSLPKAPKFSTNIVLSHYSEFDDLGTLRSTIHYMYRDDFQYRVYANSELDTVDSYDLLNLTFVWTPYDGDWGLELIVSNVMDDDIVNSRFTDAFGVNNTSEEFIAPREFLLRASYSF